MSVHAKLMRARLMLQSRQLKKTGHNKFAGYYYFELGDFLPAVQEIFHEVGLCGIVSYDQTIATLTITDLDKGGAITITSPMAEANLKGAHPIQNLGAVETYTRRYLWVTAMEIVEHDALDATTGKDAPKSFKSTPVGEDPFALVPAEEHEYIRELADKIRSVSAEEANEMIAAKSFKSTPVGEDPFALVPAEEHEYIRELADKIRSVSAEEANEMIAAENLEAEQKVALWSLLDSKTRSAIKKVKSNEQI